MCNVGWLTDFEPTLLDIFRAEPGTAFAFHEADQRWVQVRDWSPEE